ncbi:MAG: transposase [Treponema sp.]|jgi:transposase-like protein|nr:transposase [Treponema sp.]
MEKRKRYTPEEKVLVLREVVEDGKAVSTVANEHELNPKLILLAETADRRGREYFQDTAGRHQRERPGTALGNLKRNSLSGKI